MTGGQIEFAMYNSFELNNAPTYAKLHETLKIYIYFELIKFLVNVDI